MRSSQDHTHINVNGFFFSKSILSVTRQQFVIINVFRAKNILFNYQVCEKSSNLSEKIVQQEFINYREKKETRTDIKPIGMKINDEVKECTKKYSNKNAFANKTTEVLHAKNDTKKQCTHCQKRKNNIGEQGERMKIEKKKKKQKCICAWL